jgi:hypothetical protein
MGKLSTKNRPPIIIYIYIYIYKNNDDTTREP